MTLVDRLKRRNLILGVVAALLVAWIVLRPAETSVVRKEALPALFPDLVLENVRQIQIQRPTATDVTTRPTQDTGDIVLGLRDNAQWVVASSHGYPASTEKVTAFLEALQAAKRKLFVSGQVKTFDDYAPTDGWIRVMVQGAGGTALASFDLGKSAAWSEPYVRVEEDGNPVILRAWNLASDRISLTLDKWADVAVWPGLTLPAVDGVDVFQREEKGTLSFVKEEREVESESPPEDGAPVDRAVETVWTMRAPTEAEAVRSRVENLVRAFTGMRIRKVVAREGSASSDAHFGLDNPSYRIVLKTSAPKEGGKAKTWILKIGKRVPPATEDGTSDGWYVRRGGDDWVFEVDAVAIADAQEPAESYLPEPEPADEESADEPKDGDEGAAPSDQATGGPEGAGDPDEPLPPLPPIDPEPQDPPK